MISNNESKEIYYSRVPLDILVVGSSGGTEQAHFGKYISSLAKAGHKITFVGWDRYDKLPKSYQQGKILRRMIFHGWGYGNKLLMFALPLWCIRLFSHLLFQKSDIIIAFNLDCMFPAILSGFFRHIPLVYVILDTYSLRPTIPQFMRDPIRRVDNWVMKKSDRIIVPDENRILDEYKQKEKFTVIYNCCTDISDTIPKERKNRAGKPFTILTNGRLMKNRGLKLLLSAAQMLPDMHVILAGDIFERDIQELVNSTPNVKFFGKVPLFDAYQLYFDADVIFTFYDPSSDINRLAASNKWSDAMMASRPILINSELAKADWIRKTDVGYLCPYGDVAALVKCLTYIRDNPEEARYKGENGRKLFIKGYKWKQMEHRLWKLIDQLAIEPPMAKI